MDRAPCFLGPLLAVAVASILTGCASPRHALPLYEKPMARTSYQDVRTTAYTHTEADHLEYGNHNALGGTLRAAGPPFAATGTAVMSVATFPAINVNGPDDDVGGFHQPGARPSAGAVSTGTTAWPASANGPDSHGPDAVYGSAAADWSRWPAGTTFRIVSTGQLYRVDDYGWALAGRNTIDLYMPTRATMNAWGVRREPIQILEWGDREESLRRLRNHQAYRHIRRMVLELEGHERAAANLD